MCVSKSITCLCFFHCLLLSIVVHVIFCARSFNVIMITVIIIVSNIFIQNCLLRFKGGGGKRFVLTKWIM